MGLDISTVVNVSISRTTAQVTQKGFGRALILGITNQSDKGTAKLYASIAEVAVDFDPADPEYLAAAAMFSQSPAPNDVYIGIGDSGTDPDAMLTALTANGYTDFYAILLAGTINTAANIALVAAWVEAQSFKRIFLASVKEAGILDAGSTTDVAYLTKAANYSRTAVAYSGATNDYLLAAAWAGKMLPVEPGSSNYAFKTLVGITADDLTSAELAAAEGKNANVYVNIGGVSVTQLGTMADAEPIDIIVGVDWLQSIIQQDIYTLLVNVPKVPFTDAGISQVLNVLTGDLKQAVSQGVLASYNVPEVKASDYTAAQRQSRVLSGITFTGQLAGAVNKVTVVGNVYF